MKKVVKFAGLALAATCVFGAASCGPKQLAIGKDYIVATSQLDALTKLDTGYANVAIIDSVMAGYYTQVGQYAGKMQVVEEIVFEDEYYGIAAYKGNAALISKINEGLKLTYQSGKYTEIAEEFGVTATACLTGEEVNPEASATDSSWQNVVNRGQIVIGYTYFAPIAFENAGGQLTGFDVELAREVIAALNAEYDTDVEVTFLEIDWNNKENDLEQGMIDLVWNGMTITPERIDKMQISVPYLTNRQVAVVLNKDADVYTSIESMKDAIMTAEDGSAGEAKIKG